MRPMLTGTLLAAGLWCAPATTTAQQQAPPCTQDSSHAAMQARMGEWDRVLEAKLAEADRAKGDRKVTALTEAVRELIAQRRAMHEHMADRRAARAACPAHGGHQMPGAGTGGPGPCPRHPAARGGGSP